MLKLFIGTLWALKVAGLTEISYQQIIIISVVMIVISAICSTIYQILVKRSVIEEVAQLEKGDIDNTESAILAMLSLIYMRFRQRR